jgi:hypothetical protein
MRQFVRVVIYLLVAASLAVFVVNAAWWARSYFMADVILRLSTDKPSGAPATHPAVPYRARRIFAIAPMRGRLQIGYARQARASFTLLPDGWMRQSVPTRLVMGSRAPWKKLGFGYAHDVAMPSVVVTENGAPINDPATVAPLAESWNVWVPCWFIALLTVVGPVIWFRSGLRHFRERAIRAP